MTDKMYTKHINHKMLKGLMMLALVLFAAAMIFAASASDTYAADDTSIREAHKIKVNGKNYCLFVAHNVVLTPEDIAKWEEEIQKKVETERKEEIKKEYKEQFEKEAEEEVERDYPDVTDEDERKKLIEEIVNRKINEKIKEIVEQELKEKLANEILTRSGLYMKQTNCKIATHKKIDLKTWNEKVCKLALIEEQLNDYIASIEGLENGKPYITYMDLCISKDKKSSVVPEESAKKLSEELKVAELLMVAMATESDAKDPDNVCKEENKPVNPAKKEKKKQEKTPKTPDSKEKEEILPEMRTIPMADRSGDPLKATLEDGSPVTLEWIDPGSEPDGDKSFWDRIPGGILTPIALLLGLLLLLILLLKRRKQDDSE